MPRKSAASATATTDVGGDTSMVSNTDGPPQKEKAPKKTSNSKANQELDGFTIDDLLLPRSLVSRIARGVLPPNTSLQKDAILALAKSATVFISHLAAEANDLTDRKTVQSGDVIKAIREIEMEQVMGLGNVGADGRLGGRLEREITLYEESIKGKRKGYREKVKARESGVSQAATADGEGEVEDRGHENKRIRRDPELYGDAEMLDVSKLENSGETQHGVGVNGAHGIKTSNVARGTGKSQPDQAEENSDDDDANDQTETDPEMADEEDDEEQDDDEEEGESDEEDEEDTRERTSRHDQIEVDDGQQQGSRRKKNGMLAPNGRIEVVAGSDDESD